MSQDYATGSGNTPSRRAYYPIESVSSSQAQLLQHVTTISQASHSQPQTTTMGNKCCPLPTGGSDGAKSAAAAADDSDTLVAPYDNKSRQMYKLIILCTVTMLTVFVMCISTAIYLGSVMSNRGPHQLQQPPLTTSFVDGPYTFGNCAQARAANITFAKLLCDSPCWSEVSATDFSIKLSTRSDALMVTTTRTVTSEINGVLHLSGFDLGQCGSLLGVPNVGDGPTGLVIRLDGLLTKVPSVFKPTEGRSTQMTIFPMPFDQPSPALVYIQDRGDLWNVGLWTLVLPKSLIPVDDGSFFIVSSTSQYVIADDA